ncbi:MAG TPA: hypothetical protein DCR55_06505 [Lentisphaeria bacterium]|nr:hypothetical protein [Lentisphaeria bacterium]
MRAQAQRANQNMRALIVPKKPKQSGCKVVVEAVLNRRARHGQSKLLHCFGYTACLFVSQAELMGPQAVPSYFAIESCYRVKLDCQTRTREIDNPVRISSMMTAATIRIFRVGSCADAKAKSRNGPKQARYR